MIIDKFINDVSKIKLIYIINGPYVGICNKFQILHGIVICSNWYYSDYSTLYKCGRADLDRLSFNKSVNTKNQAIRNAIRKIKFNHPNIIKIPKKHLRSFSFEANLAYLEYN